MQGFKNGGAPYGDCCMIFNKLDKYLLSILTFWGIYVYAFFTINIKEIFANLKFLLKLSITIVVTFN
ncbi:MAG: hypothetical protein EAZ25_20880 [Oscillatoriales cyanobacterium]|nr:MAG: hypothetical protein EAZ86_28430 [Oscillatoriales cyanobacterium]TAG64317.1 MAG: hypothetical protein EAZ25_20880 [Oscillatoriales cyanobacterium]